MNRAAALHERRDRRLARTFLLAGLDELNYPNVPPALLAVSALVSYSVDTRDYHTESALFPGAVGGLWIAVCWDGTVRGR